MHGGALREAALDPGRGRRLVARLFAALTAWPAYRPSAADLRTVRVVGLDLPYRASLAVLVTTVVLLLDYTRTFIPDEIQALGRAAEAMRFQAIERAILYGLVPLLVVLALFRDRPGRYGLRLGDWRIGLSLAVVGCAVMTPIVLTLAGDEHFQGYYASSAAGLGDLLLTHALDLVPAEFLHRGFLMFALLRVIGPFGIVVANIPFVFVHLGKPELELFSTLAGGLVFGWLNWRTGSIVWSALGHIYILTLLLVAIAGVG